MINKLYLICFFVLASTLCTTLAAGAECENVKIIVMRHGSAEHMLENVRNSRVSSPLKHLTQEGVSEVIQSTFALMKANPKLKPDTISAIYVSPLIRTQETAAVFYHALTQPVSPKGRPAPAQANPKMLKKWIEQAPLQLKAEIQERDFGKCEGTKREKDLTGCSAPASHRDKNSLNYTIETDEAVFHRSFHFLKNLRANRCESGVHFKGKPHTLKDNQETFVVIVTHEIVARDLAQILSPQSAEQKLDFAPAATRVFKLSDYVEKEEAPGSAQATPIASPTERPDRPFDYVVRP